MIQINAGRNDIEMDFPKIHPPFKIISIKKN